MGYTTDFDGELNFNKVVDEKTMSFVNALANTRRMRRDVNIIKEMDPDWAKHCLDGDLGKDGEFYIIPNPVPVAWLRPNSLELHEAEGQEYVFTSAGQVHDRSVLSYNYPPIGQPGLWLDWIMPDQKTLCWDGSEKFYNYIEWLEYLIQKIFAPKDYILNGEIRWRGEDFEDVGSIKVVDNKVIIRSLF